MTSPALQSIGDVPAAPGSDLTLTPIKGEELTCLRAFFERPQQSQWVSEEVRKEETTPCLLPFRQGDGQKAMMLSFYSAPELALVVLVDSGLPGDSSLCERCSDNPPPSFRELVDDIYDCCEGIWDEPPAGDYRLEELRQSQKEWSDDPEDLPELWAVIIQDGSCWTLADRQPSQNKEAS